ncbi:MAG TPA: succinate dehydrogenase cytochrome b subunit [Prolixibacteraceae bacterium]|jgi:succinate dehydrogenase / fumarate reductase cytochrome b subunit
MSNLLTASIGKKLLMSVSGLFLILFLFVHLILNSFLVLDGVMGFQTGQMFNAGAHFMATNPFIKVMEPMLALGFIVHILYSLILTFQNMKARGPQKYASGNKTTGVEWASQNMLVLGIVIFSFLIVHMFDFFMKMRGYIAWTPGEAEFPFFGSMAKGEDAYSLVNATFKILPIVIIYIIGSVALAFHLAHGFWSSFQTIGWNNTTWMPRLRCASNVVAIILGGGFTIIALAQYLFF